MNERITVEHIGAVMDYAAKHGSVTNRECREVTDLSYNRSIKILTGMCALGMLRKIGINSTTKYVVTGQQSARPARPGFHRKTYL